MSMLKNPNYVKGGFVCIDKDGKPEPSLTKQSLAEDADINVIVSRFLKTGVLPNASTPPQYGDVSALPGLQDALNQVRTANGLFMALPAQIRAEIGHDPTKLEGWLADPRNLELARSLGVVQPAPVPPAPVASATPSNPPPKGGTEVTP